MTPIEEIKTLCASVVERWTNGTLPDKMTNVAVFAETILTILNKNDNENSTV